MDDNVVSLRVVEKVPVQTSKANIVENLEKCLERIKSIPEESFNIPNLFVVEIHEIDEGWYFNTWFAGKDRNRMEVMGIMSHVSTSSHSPLHWQADQHEPLY